jgi:hypothetical protein
MKIDQAWSLHTMCERLVKMLYAQHGVEGLAMLYSNTVYEMAELDPEIARTAIETGASMVKKMVRDGTAVETGDRGKTH